MDNQDLEYVLARMCEERKAAEAAADENTRAVHAEMAARYHAILVAAGHPSVVNGEDPCCKAA